MFSNKKVTIYNTIKTDMYGKNLKNITGNELIENSTKHSNETTNEEWHTPLPF